MTEFFTTDAREEEKKKEVQDLVVPCRLTQNCSSAAADP